ncbi:MAG TPA: SOS response-associated peptidase [Bacteroidetes bacterium]|nr:SOS response-associated peptidase [Bacteroidota bacterium]
MCYDVAAHTLSQIKYAKHRHGDASDTTSLQEVLSTLMPTLPKAYHVSGFAHPRLLSFIQGSSDTVQLSVEGLEWGLIPFWVKDGLQAAQIANNTLNARLETLLEKPSFRAAARYRRCLIYVDGFFEHHHRKGKRFPFFIRQKESEVMCLAGVYEDWTDQLTGEIKRTCAVVTTEGHGEMVSIHNNPKLPESRMPLILSRENQEEWLAAENQGSVLEKQFSYLANAVKDVSLLAHEVRPIRGKHASANNEEAWRPVPMQSSLF